MKQVTLNKKQYDKIRKMDHGQMQNYFKECMHSATRPESRRRLKSGKCQNWLAWKMNCFQSVG